MTRLVQQCLATGGLAKRYRPPAKGFGRTYTTVDVALLAETDALHATLSGPATKHLMQRALTVFDDTRYARLASISVAHLYNLRAAAGYRVRRQQWAKTRPTWIAIGQRRAPQPDGRPGYLRIDSVHQGDEDGVKGVYHINVVDCVTQWEVVATCEKLSEAPGSGAFWPLTRMQAKGGCRLRELNRMGGGRGRDQAIWSRSNDRAGDRGGQAEMAEDLGDHGRMFDGEVAFAQNPHFVKLPVCTEIQTAKGPAIRCIGGKIAGLGNDPVFASIEAALACEVTPGTNKPGGHLQSDTVEIVPRNGQITLPTLTTNAAKCPRGLNPVVGETVDLVIKNAEGDVIFNATLSVQ
ncbi:MAG: hypothetical protein ACREU9_06060 [Gammaproteobacteria bacterium]